MTAQRVFTISEVNALIPDLSELVGDQLREQSDIEHDLAELTRLSGVTPDSLEPGADDRPEVLRLKHDLKKRIQRYEAGWARVQTMGGVIKDPQIGLVDFYGRIGEKLVWLCWRYGEDSLAYYHELESGYRGRRPLSADVRRHLLN
ncbi:MAG TPA: DUF2203 domain-containing protein [Polyangiaceae bacterium]|nr:DUF2203 domain-containing protein [Polyangiaceae bacterium]